MNLSSKSLIRVASSVAAACLAVSTAFFVTPSATANPRVATCTWAHSGTNLNQYFGTSAAVMIPRDGCDRIKTGVPWTTPAIFYIARTWEQIPAGYVTNGATPLEELEHDVVRLRFIVDEGTSHQFSVERSASQIDFRVRDWRVIYPEDPDWLMVDIGTSITLRPLPAGQHTIRGEFEVSRPSCDGTSSDWVQSCIPQGVFPYPDTRTFTVVPRS